MANGSVQASKRRVVLVYYSQSAREGIEDMLFHHGLEVYAIYGRAYDAIDGVRRHPAGAVVVDESADDVSINQAIRHIAQALPGSLVMTVCPHRHTVDIYRSGHRMGEAESLEAALERYS